MDKSIAPPPPPSAYCVEDSVGYQMRRIVNLIGGEIERQVEPLALTDAQWKPLLRLYLEPENATVAGLARRCWLDAGAMTRLLDRLEGKGLCRRVRSLEDRRVVQLELTEEGQATAQKIPDVLIRMQDLVSQGFSADEYEQLRGFLSRMLENLQPLSGAACAADVREGDET